MARITRNCKQAYIILLAEKFKKGQKEKNVFSNLKFQAEGFPSLTGHHF